MPEGNRAECSVGGGMRVAANDRHARKGNAVLRADDMNDAVLRIAQSPMGDMVFCRILFQGPELVGGERVRYRQMLVDGRRIMIGRGECFFGEHDIETAGLQSQKGDRTGHFVNKMPVDKEDIGAALDAADGMAIPDAVK